MQCAPLSGHHFPAVAGPVSLAHERGAVVVVAATRDDVCAVGDPCCVGERRGHDACLGEAPCAAADTVSTGDAATSHAGRRSYAPPPLGRIEPRRDSLPPPPIVPEVASWLRVTNLGTLLDVLA